MRVLYADEKRIVCQSSSSELPLAGAGFWSSASQGRLIGTERRQGIEPAEEERPASRAAFALGFSPNTSCRNCAHPKRTLVLHVISDYCSRWMSVQIHQRRGIDNLLLHSGCVCEHANAKSQPTLCQIGLTASFGNYHDAHRLHE